ncbi:MAG TPA: S41 family peptidase [Trueperaceae bacterium]|nr:S41 family peptidase [Trueperaceae bacterium]
MRALLLAALLLAPSALAAGPLWASSQGRERVFQAVVDVFRDRYWDPGWMDWQAWSARFEPSAVDAGSRAAFDEAMRSMVGAVHDGHSNWLGLASYGGGATSPRTAPTIGVITTYLDGEGLVIEHVLPGTPAAEAGLQRGDVVVRVGDEDLSGEARWDAGLALSRAVRKGAITLTVRRVNATRSVTLTPEPLAQSVLTQEPSGRMLGPDTAYIYLPSLNAADTAARFHALLRALQGKGATSLILDMRGNYGGRLGQLGLVLGAFVDGAWAKAVSRGHIAWEARYRVIGDEGVSTLVTEAGAVVGEDRVKDPVRFDGRVIVLVDRDNSSAGEVGPLALQDLGRARVVGERTNGNVEAIQGFDLPDGSTVMVAVANMEGIDGRAFDGGVVPNVRAAVSVRALARGYDAPVAAAQALLHDLPFTPGRVF